MQVKFRGKRAHDGAWVIGNLITANNGSIYIYEPKELIEDGHHLIIDSDEPHWVVPESVGMFTGLTDKNGKEIYGAVGENGGDILKYTYLYYRNPLEIITTVKWEYHGFYIGRNETKFIDSRALYWMKKYGEVIGNAFDNHELLEK